MILCANKETIKEITVFQNEMVNSSKNLWTCVILNCQCEL